ncbi:MAG TPA: hypothetical protein VGM69_14870 [Chloroflexota bacterium]|jgi:hypothetical protein
MSRHGVTSAVTPRATGTASRFTLRGLSEPTIQLLNEDADRRGLSLNRYMLLVLEERAEIGRRRAQLERLRRRLDTASEGLAAQLSEAGRTSSNSAVLLWRVRGER